MIKADNACIYKDEGISGTKPLEERPGFSRLQEDILNSAGDEKPFDVVAVYKIDRFARKLRILLNAIDFFEKYGVKFVSANESIDTSTSFGRAILGIVGVLAELELDTIKERTLAGKKEAHLKGVYMGSTPKYGYIKDENGLLVIFDKEAQVVHEIFDMFVSGGSAPHGIAKILTDKKEPSPQVSAILHHKRKGTVTKESDIYFWRDSQIVKIIKDEVYIGKLYQGKTDHSKPIPKEKWSLSPHRHAPIIDEETFKSAQEILKKGALTHKSRSISESDYLLSGLIKCDACHDPGKYEDYHSWQGTRGKIDDGRYSYYYKCGRKKRDKSTINCHSIPLPARQLETYVVNRVLELLDNPQIAYKYQNELRSAQLARGDIERDTKVWRELLEKLPNKRKNILEQHKSSYISKPQLDAEIAELNSEETEYKKRLQELSAKTEAFNLTDLHLKSLDLFKAKYLDMLRDFRSNRLEAKKILSTIIDRIMIYSRPVKETDIISGRRTLEQKIPYMMDIEVKLPPELVKEVYEKKSKFGVKKSIW